MIPGIAWYVIRNRTGLLVSCYGKELKNTERGTQLCNNGRPTPVCDPYRPHRKYSLVHSSSMKGRRLNFHAERELAHPKTTFFSSFLQFQPFKRLYSQLTFFKFLLKKTTVPPRTSSSCCLSLFKEASYTQTTSAEVPVSHTPVEVAEVK